MGNNISINKININRINFKDVQYAITNNMIIISTLDVNNQECLIKNTLKTEEEINIINDIIQKKKNSKIIIYGENCSDDSIVKKYYQLKSFGIKNIYIYIGGLFEWLLLQDIFGVDEFPTTTEIIDILNYKGEICYNLRSI